MRCHLVPERRKFDRIIYYFPHSGLSCFESDPKVIMKHQYLVSGFFLNAKQMILEDVVVHVTHKTDFPFNQSKNEELAGERKLDLPKKEKFNAKEYIGYHPRRVMDQRPTNHLA